QSTNSIPSLKVAFVDRTKSSSFKSSNRLKYRMCGMVDSPTPTVPIASDSIRRILISGAARRRAIAAAAIHPAVPPPTITVLRILRSCMVVTVPRVVVSRDVRGAVPLNELDVRGHRVGGSGDAVAYGIEAAADRVVGYRRHGRIAGLRHDALSEQDRDPARCREQLFLVAEDAASFAKQRDLVAQRVRNLHRPAIVPERRVVAFGRAIVQDDEIAHLLELERHVPVVFVADDLR